MLERKWWGDRRARIVAGVIASLCMLIGVAGASALSFTSPRTIGKAGQSHGFPRIAIDSQGRGTVVWHNYERRNGRIEAVQMSAGKIVGSSKVLSDPSFDANNAQVGVDGDGRAVVVWQASKGDASPIQLTTFGPGGQQGPVENLPGEGSEPEIAVNDSGAFAGCWTRYNDQGGADLAALLVQPDGTSGPVATLDSDVDPTGDDLAQVAIDASGRATVMWEASRRNPTIYAAQLDGSGIVAQPRALSNPKKPSYIGALATDQDGATAIVWTQRSGEVKVRRLASDGKAGATRTLSGRGLTGRPNVVIDSSGRSTVAWTTGSGLLRWVRLDPKGIPGPKRRLKARGAGANDMAVDESGRVWIAWNRASYQKKSGSYSGSIRTMRLSATGRAGRVRTLTGPKEDTYDFQGLSRPDIALDRRGIASVVWPDTASTNARIRLIRSVP